MGLAGESQAAWVNGMLTETRWQKEQELMRSVFPEFTPFTKSSRFGFEGDLKGPKSGSVYHVILEADQEAYPQCPPNVFMDPRIGMCWIGTEDRRKLCMQKEWRPGRSTFANTLLAVIRYLDEFDPQPGSASQADRADGDDRLPARDSDVGPGTGGGLVRGLFFYGNRGLF